MVVSEFCFVVRVSSFCVLVVFDGEGGRFEKLVLFLFYVLREVFVLGLCFCVVLGILWLIVFIYWFLINECSFYIYLVLNFCFILGF